MSDQSIDTAASGLIAAEALSAPTQVAGTMRVAQRRRRFRPWLALVYIYLTVMTLFSAFPIFYVIQASLSDAQTLYSTQLRLLPPHPTLSNYTYVLTQLPFFQWVGNSLFVTFLSTLAGLALSTAGAYALSRFHFIGRQYWLVMLIALQAFPSLLALLAYYLMYVNIQNVAGIDLFNLLGLSLIYTAGAVTFGAWNMKGYFDTLPVELEQAALVDGATPTQAFLRVTLPLALPALASTALLMSIGQINEFALANLILFNQDQAGPGVTFILGLRSLQTDYRVPWGYFAAASTLVSLPLMALFFYVQRFFKSGLTIGSVKG
jgi:arabinogalactan oligomer / maltooligosaccharide transport system permease protein